MTRPTRADLISLATDAVVPQSLWHDRDSASAQIQVGEALALLRAGCEFAIDTSSHEGTWWIHVTYRGFSDFENDTPASAHEFFYIPTRSRLDAAGGKDWY